jgi:hypothetical protein
MGNQGGIGCLCKDTVLEPAGRFDKGIEITLYNRIHAFTEAGVFTYGVPYMGMGIDKTGYYDIFGIRYLFTYFTDYSVFDTYISPERGEFLPVQDISVYNPLAGVGRHTGTTWNRNLK